jgi:hypothetical protein
MATGTLNVFARISGPTGGSSSKLNLYLDGIRNTIVTYNQLANDSIRTIDTGMPSGGGGATRPTTGQLYPRGV